MINNFAKHSNVQPNNPLTRGDAARATVQPFPFHLPTFLFRDVTVLYLYTSNKTDTKIDFNYVQENNRPRLCRILRRLVCVYFEALT